MRPLISGAILILILVAALYVPVQLPYKAESIGRVMPAEEWQLLQDQTGRLSSVVRNHIKGAVTQIDAFQFDQGDFSGLDIDIPEGAFVHAGDTVVRMYSIQQSQEIQELEAQLSLYQAQLKAETTGDKPPIVQEAENKLHFAEQDLKLKESLYLTNKKLKDEGLLAVMEFQTSENEYNLAKIQVEISRKYLENVNTGLKVESVGITEAQLQGLRNRLAILRKKGLSFVLRAPFRGYATPTMLPEELFTMQTSDEYVVQIPVKVEQLPHLTADAKISVIDVATGKVFNASFLNVLPKVEVLDNRQVAMIAASVKPDSAGLRLSTGVSVRCAIDFGKVNQREYLKRILNLQW
ncbi:MAG: hypothetical protein JNJ57_16230 [Saprospiraceae bacterium]|nr:hypothetical protein [Saprospiraceae bacterium]